MKQTIKNIVRILSISFAFFVVTPQLANAATNLNFTDLGTHPQAAAQSTNQGQHISKLVLFDGKIYAGYGDVNANTGPIHINPFNLTTNLFEGSVLSVPTESIEVWRIIDGKLYAPTLDPTCNATCAAGYAVGSVGGAWEVKLPINAEHVWDIATYNGTDLWLLGSAGGSTATAWRSTNGGTSWSVVQTRNINVGANNGEAYNWAANINNTMYLQSNYADSNHPVATQQFNGSTWSEGITESACKFDAVVFLQKIICTTSGKTGLTTFDGNTVENIEFPDKVIKPDSSCNSSIGDHIVAENRLFVLCGSGYELRIISTDDLQHWRLHGTPPLEASSLAVSNNHVYVGTTDSKLMASPLDLSDDTDAPEITVTQPINNSAFLNTTASAQITDNNGIGKVEFYVDGAVVETLYPESIDQETYQATLENILNGQNEWTKTGQHVFTIKAYDTSGNATTSAPVNFAFTEPDFTVNKYNVDNSSSDTAIITSDKNGNVWFASKKDDLFRIGKSTQSGELSYFALPADIAPQALSGMFADSFGNIWFADCINNKIGRLQIASGVVDQYAMPFTPVGCYISNFAETEEDSLLISIFGAESLIKITQPGVMSTIELPTGYTASALTSNNQGKGLLSVANDDNTEGKLFLVEGDDSLTEISTSESYIVITLVVDKENNIWLSGIIGSSGGLGTVKLNSNYQEILNVPVGEYGLAYSRQNSILAMSAGIVAETPVLLSGLTGQVTNLSQIIPTGPAYATTSDSFGNIWYIGDGVLYKLGFPDNVNSGVGSGIVQAATGLLAKTGFNKNALELLAYIISSIAGMYLVYRKVKSA